MVSVKLHGIFENYLKLDWQLNVSSVSEIFDAIEANTGSLVKTLGHLESYISNFIIYVDGKITPPEYLDSPILKKDSIVEIVPLLIGSDFGITAFLLMLVVSIGIQLLISKIMTPKSPVDVKTNSRLFSGYENVTKRNVPIPLGYGRVKIGSIVISNNLLINNQLGQG